MRKLASIFVTLMLMLTGIAAAFAQDANVTTNATTTTEVTANTTVVTPTEVEENETQKAPKTDEVENETPSNDTKDVEPMTDHPGVVMRVTQLQERIERAVVNGQTIISQLSAKNVSVTGLQSILDQLKALEPQAAATADIQDVSDATAQFVAIKKQAIDLVKQFRDKVRALVPAGQRDELKKRARDAEADQLKAIRQKAEKARDEFNAQTFADILQRLGTQLPDIEAKLRNGAISVQDAKKALRDAFTSLSTAKKAEARQKLMEKASERRVKLLANLQRLKGKVEGKEQMASEKNLTRLQKNLQNKEGRIDNRIGKIEAKNNSTGGSNE